MLAMTNTEDHKNTAAGGYVYANRTHLFKKTIYVKRICPCSKDYSSGLLLTQGQLELEVLTSCSATVPQSSLTASVG